MRGDVDRHRETNYVLTDVTDGEWQTLLERCPGATVFHSLEWRDAVEDAFKQLNPFYLALRRDDAVVGGIPAFIFEPIPGVRLWHAMPWNLFGGVLVPESEAVDVQSVLHVLERLASSHKWCEIRWTFPPGRFEAYDDVFVGYDRTDHFTHILRTDRDVDSVWTAYNKRVRGAVRKAARSGVEVVDTSALLDLRLFYEMYLRTVRRLGGTPKPFALLRSLVERGIGCLTVARSDGQLIAGLLWLRFNRTVTLWCEASVPAFLKYRPNNAIFHHIIEQACAGEWDCVDFGASPPENAGLIAHKEQYRAVRTDFASYTRVVSPMRRAVWTGSEGALRRVYSWLQSLESSFRGGEHPR